MNLQVTKSQAGFGIVESMLAAMILLFVLSSGFLLLNSVLINITLENKKDEIASILDERVNIYRLTGVFDDSKTEDGIEFKKTVVLKVEKQAKPKKEKRSVDRFNSYSIADIKKMAEKADKKQQKEASNNVKVIYKLVNIAAFDDTMGVADRVKIIQREVEQNDSQKKE
ncbi:pilus assembly protein [Francisella sp. SYW-9]|uniref:pilus assembly protein n=1 Tax=Francisella sp. SYW-9 TaxID=2610888 RepID=UPI00123D3309|nr:pilus assembly protein [Francisella sp. SYW-9]